MSKEDLEKRIEHLDECIAKALPSSARALTIHRDALARVLEKYNILPYEHEGPQIKVKKARAKVEKV